MQQLLARFPHTLELRFQPEAAPGAVVRSYTERVRGRDDVDLACGFLEHVRGRPAEDAEIGLLRQAVLAGRMAQAEQLGASALPAAPADDPVGSDVDADVHEALPLEDAG
jgi:exonuclease SbcD